MTTNSMTRTVIGHLTLCMYRLPNIPRFKFLGSLLFQFRLYLEVPFPNCEDRWINNEFHQE